MHLANRVKIDRMSDHFVLRFFMSCSPSTENEEEVATLAIPLTTGMDLSLHLFEQMFHSILDLQVHIGEVQRKINNLNVIAHEAQERALKIHANKEAT